MRFRIGSLFASLLLLTGFATAQAPAGYMTVSGSNLTDATGTKITNATITFAPETSSGLTVSARANGNGQVISTPVSTQVTTGAFSIRLADVYLTNPQNICYSVSVIDNTTGNSLFPTSGYNCVQPASTGQSYWCSGGGPSTSGGNCNFDLYIPLSPPGALVTAGPIGPTGPAGTNGANGPNCNVLSPPGECDLTNVKATNVLSPIQEQHPYALRNLLTKVTNMQFNRAGVTGYSTPTQAVMAIAGDSTGPFHVTQLWCYLSATYGGAGYIVNGESGDVLINGTPCGATNYSNLAGFSGATFVTNDYTHFPDGQGWSIPAGGYVLNGTGQFANSTRQIAYYTVDAGGVTTTVSTSPDNTTYTALSNGTGSTCNGISSAHVGTVCDSTITKGKYWLKIASSGGTTYLWATGQVDTTINGMVQAVLSITGGNPANFSYPSTAITGPWYTDLHPDIITSEWKANSEDGSCNAAPTANPSNSQTWAYWFNTYMNQLKAGNPYADFVILGDYDIGTTTCTPSNNAAYQAWAMSQTRPGIYVDLFSQMPLADEVTYGWLSDTGNVHQNGLGQTAGGNWLLEYLGLAQWNLGFMVRDVINNAVTTNSVTIPGGGQIIGPFDINIKTARSLALYNQSSNNLLMSLADPSTGPGASGNFMPPFQLGNASNLSSSNVWIEYDSTGTGAVQKGIFGQSGGYADWKVGTLKATTDVQINGISAGLKVASGATALGTSVIAAGTCSNQSIFAGGVLTTDVVVFSPNARLNTVTGYTPSTSGGLTITAYPISNNVNFDVCNWSNASITPGAVTVNWKVIR